ncbi:MAG: hypothetical protein MRJ96_10205 [Nitrospirales bacterium]|nr:hypothetical protein [Nitrospira sp.]MDR4501810.1 hypothetical protein [Nitrospirales bacterium]
MTNPLEISDAFRTMCKVAVEAGLSRKEMENAVDAAWLVKADWERQFEGQTTYQSV